MKALDMNTLLRKMIIGFAMLWTGCQVNVYDETPVPVPVPTPTPCHHGVNGMDGRSFFALDYDYVAPAYIWGNNPAIPSYFQFGSFYSSPSGTFRLYYEGSFMNGCCLTEYYWDVDYTVWINPGTLGDCGYNGLDGADSFLTIWMNPEGPDFGRVNKNDPGADNVVVLERTDDTVLAEQTMGAYKIKIRYTRLKTSKKDSLSASEIMEGTE